MQLKWEGKSKELKLKKVGFKLRERVGEPGNMLIFGENAAVMNSLLPKYKGKVNLIYIDPPFYTNKNWNRKTEINDQEVKSAAFTDKWKSEDEYLQFMYERLILMRELLAEDGSIYVHCDWRENHHLRCILDEIFGSNTFRNQILVRRVKKNFYSRKKTKSLHEAVDYILFYSKSASHQICLPQKYAPKPERWHAFDSAGTRKGMDYLLFNNKPKPGNHWRWKKERAEQAIKKGLLRANSSTGKPEYKIDATDFTIRDSLWEDVTCLAFKNSYPTEKKESLIEMILEMSSKPGDLVLDCFMGSGTTTVVAEKLGRRYIGVDSNSASIAVTRKRLLELSSPNFEVYNADDEKIQLTDEIKVRRDSSTIEVMDFKSPHMSVEVKDFKELIDYVVLYELNQRLELIYTSSAITRKKNLINLKFDIDYNKDYVVMVVDKLGNELFSLLGAKA